MTAYIKPTRYVHSSGYRMFEVGYLEIGSNGRVTDKEVLGKCTDHVFTDFMVLTGQHKPFSISMDLTKDGYIRLWSNQGKLKWDNEKFALSDMGLVLADSLESKEKI